MIALSYSARCVDPRYPDCGWTGVGPAADLEARRHSGETKLKGGPKPPHATITEATPC